MKGKASQHLTSSSPTKNPDKDGLLEKDDKIYVLVLHAELNEAIVFGSPDLKYL